MVVSTFENTKITKGAIGQLPNVGEGLDNCQVDICRARCVPLSSTGPLPPRGRAPPTTTDPLPTQLRTPSRREDGHLHNDGPPPAERAGTSNNDGPPSNAAADFLPPRGRAPPQRRTPSRREGRHLQQRRTPFQRSCGLPPAERTGTSTTTDPLPPKGQAPPTTTDPLPTQLRTPSRREDGHLHNDGPPPAERAGTSNNDGPPPAERAGTSNNDGPPSNAAADSLPPRGRAPPQRRTPSRREGRHLQQRRTPFQRSCGLPPAERTGTSTTTDPLPPRGRAPPTTTDPLPPRGRAPPTTTDPLPPPPPSRRAGGQRSCGSPPSSSPLQFLNFRLKFSRTTRPGCRPPRSRVEISVVEISAITGTEQPNRHGLCWRVRRCTLSSLERLDGALSRPKRSQQIHPITSYVYLRKVFVCAEFKLKKVADDGVVVDVPANAAVGLIQMSGATFIRNLKVHINQREVYDSNQLYSYKVFLDTELSYPVAAKDSYFGVACYFRDSYPTKISNVEIDIELALHSDEFMIHQETANRDTYTLEVVDSWLIVKVVDLMDGLSLDIAKKLDMEPARYGIRKTWMKSLFITGGRYDFSANLFTEEVPRRVIIGLVPNQNYIGHNQKNPFYFNHHNVRDIELTASGRTYPQFPYNLEGVTLIAYAEADGLILIDRNRSITSDLTGAADSSQECTIGSSTEHSLRTQRPKNILLAPSLPIYAKVHKIALQSNCQFGPIENAGNPLLRNPPAIVLKILALRWPLGAAQMAGAQLACSSPISMRGYRNPGKSQSLTTQ
ncbi:hypothetical protein niasHT_040117 [Heterodera trifolii]|uniref:Uncharacterized protein n=1 Tax=Heterodera trifolii TaxID=157864 RepID=A0ABD2I0R7_9BILA